MLEPSPIGLIGGVLAVVSCFLAWGGYDDSFDVHLQFLWDKDATGGVKLGIPLVSVAGAVALFSLSAIEPFVFLRRLGGVLLLGAHRVVRRPTRATYRLGQPFGRQHRRRPLPRGRRRPPRASLPLRSMAVHAPSITTAAGVARKEPPIDASDCTPCRRS